MQTICAPAKQATQLTTYENIMAIHYVATKAVHMTYKRQIIY
ncbi:MAG: hypothetical protein ACKO6J_09790 [Crocinitomicaceae bacterium]